MKKLLLLALAVAGQSLYAQNTAATCNNAYSLCNALGQPFSNTINDLGDNSETGGFGCLSEQSNRSWFDLPVAVNGTLSFTIEQSTNDGTLIDVNFIVWGPFDNANSCGPENLNPSTQVACSNAASIIEQFTLPNAVVGNHYMIMTTNHTEIQGTVTFNASGNTPANVVDCAVAGVNKNNLTGFMLYPNPAKNSINITSNGANIAFVKIYDLTGKTIYSSNANAERLTIDTSVFAKGTYLTEVVNSAGIKTVKKLLIN